MATGLPDEEPNTPASLEANVTPRSVPAYLFLGVILWSDDTEEDPTVIADRNPVTLARTMAVMIHEMIDDSPAYEGATEFLESNPPPQDWVLPEDVDDWLDSGSAMANPGAINSTDARRAFLINVLFLSRRAGCLSWASTQLRC